MSERRGLRCEARGLGLGLGLGQAQGWGRTLHSLPPLQHLDPRDHTLVQDACCSLCLGDLAQQDHRLPDWELHLAGLVLEGRYVALQLCEVGQGLVRASTDQCCPAGAVEGAVGGEGGECGGSDGTRAPEGEGRSEGGSEGAL